MCLQGSCFITSHKIQIYVFFQSTIDIKCFQERYAVILAIKLILSMPRIQKKSKKNCHLFCAVQPINNSKKQHNCFRQAFTLTLKSSQILPHYNLEI